MAKECTKAVQRRLGDTNFINRYFVGLGVDIGGAPDPLTLHARSFPRMTGVDVWDLPQGDAQFMEGVPDGHFDFVHSSHCLEHLHDPREGLRNWFRILKPGGHLVMVVPDEDMYEQRIFPSTFNTDHKWTFTMLKETSWSDRSLNLMDMVRDLGARADVRRMLVLDAGFRDDLPRFDQTLTHDAECGIEVVIRKRPDDEVANGGRTPPEGVLGAFTVYLLTGRSIELRPAAEMIGVAVNRVQSGDLEGADRIARDILSASDTGHVADAFHVLATTARKRGDDGLARRQLAAALATRPTFPEALNSLGRLLEAAGDPAGAERAYRLSVATHPRFAEPLHAVGRLCAGDGRVPEAERVFTRLTRIRPEATGAVRTLVEIRIALRDRAGALAAVEEHAAANPGADVAPLRALCG